MLGFRGSERGGLKLHSKALPCVLLVTFCLLLMPTTVAAPSVAAAVQEISADELVALQEIARASNRYVELAANNWSWIKTSLVGIGGSIVVAILMMFIGVGTQYFVDCWKARPRWNSLMRPTLGDVFILMGTTIAYCANEVAGLRAQLAAALVWLPAALDRMAVWLPAAWYQMVAALDRVAAALDRVAAALDRNSAASHRVAAALDRVATTLDRNSAASHRVATTTEAGFTLVEVAVGVARSRLSHWPVESCSCR